MKGSMQSLWCILLFVAIIGTTVLLLCAQTNYQYRDQHAQSSRRKDERKNHFLHQFSIRDKFTLPMPNETLPFQDLMKQQWMEELQIYLHRISPNSNNSLISMVTSDSKFKDMLLNWLMSAMLKTTPRLSHVLVLSLDQPLHRTLVGHGFNSVYVDSKELLKPLVLSRLQTFKKPAAFYVAMILRLTVMRLMNHWGYDAATYDVDAVILKNPEDLYYVDFNSSDLIGSRGTFPPEVNKIFGFTLCAGVFMTKSTPKTEEFWNEISKVVMENPNDQKKLNIGLTMMNLHWDETATKDWKGRSPSGFSITILHYNHICRLTACRKGVKSYYIWHRGGKSNEKKVANAKSNYVWFLRRDWLAVAQNSTSMGINWLRKMSG